jgi:hypothetical protein
MCLRITNQRVRRISSQLFFVDANFRAGSIRLLPSCYQFAPGDRPAFCPRLEIIAHWEAPMRYV